MRKQILLVLIIGLLISACSQEKKTDSADSNLLENLTVTIDTLRVDVGEELFIPGAYQKGQISSDGKRIFFEYSENLEIHEINLDEMQLLTRHALAKDGPDRAPQYVQGFQLLPGNQFFMFAQNMAGIYDLDGKKVESISNQLSEIPGLEELEGINFFPHVWISSDRSKLMAIPFKNGEWFLKLVIVDLTAQTGRVFSLPNLDITQDYQIKWEQDNTFFTAGDFIGSYFVNDQLVIGSATTADFYLYDPKTDSIQLVENNPMELPKRKTGSVPNSVESMDAWMEVSKQLGKMVSYRDFFYDDSREIYFRLATQNGKFNTDAKLLGYELWLLSYDLDFNLTGEKLIKETSSIPINPFFKDGELYSYTVLEEDPGFAVFDFEF